MDAIELVNNTGTGAATSLASQRAARLGTGTNTAGWLEAYWNFPANYPIRNRYTEQDFRHYAAYGAKTIRLPVIFELLGSPTPPYTLNTAHVAFALVDSAIAWANRYNLNLIIDNHHGSPELSDANYVAETPHVVAIWQQLIRRYGYLNPERFFFEIYNEPNGISNANVKTVLQAAVNAIRATGDKHTLIVGGSSWNAGTSLNIMGTLADTNLIYTFHSYDPFDFCNQGFNWLPTPIPKGIPFPKNTTEIPRIKASFAAVKDWATQNNVPIFLGEFGVSIHADATSRCNWIKMMGEILDTYQIPACYWDTKYSEEAYGFFKDDMILPGNATPCFATALHWTYKATPVQSIAEGNYSLSIAPNPAAHQVHIKFEGKDHATLNVFDIQGKLVLTKKISSNNVDLDISHLIPNTYIIEVKTEEQIFRGKFVKN